MKTLPILFFALVAASPVWAIEDFKIPASVESLAAKATETVDVTLDGSLLQLAGKFLSEDDPDEAKVKRLVTKLRGVFVRSYEFDKEGQYSLADIEALRAKLKSPEWSRIVGVKSLKGENSDIYLRRSGGDISGLVVINAEPKELTIVHIDGPINIDELAELGGHMGIPKMNKDGKPKGSKSKDKEEEE